MSRRDDPERGFAQTSVTSLTRHCGGVDSQVPDPLNVNTSFQALSQHNNDGHFETPDIWVFPASSGC
jgi:hypothetical protein